MQTLILADIHANRAALGAVLDTPEARQCGAVICLGDQINYGPCPAECLAMLRAFAGEGGRALHMLRGNHEDRLPRLDGPEFDGANWRLLRWTARRLDPGEPELPVDLRFGNVLCTHGTPGDPWHLLVREEEVRATLDALPGGVDILLSGHNHRRWEVRHGGRLAVNPGSLGMWEDRVGGSAPFAVLSGNTVRLHQVPYDTDALRRDYIRSGCWREDPVLTRLSLQVMTGGESMLCLHFFRHAAAIAAEMGLPMGSEAAWQAADAAWSWPGGETTQAFWRRIEEESM